MSEWWSQRSERERRLLLVMLGLLALVLGWLLVVRPLGDALDAAKERHGAAVVALAEAKARSPSVRPPASALPLPIDGLVSRSATEAGFANARVTGQGPTRATVAIDAARPQALFGWVARLEAQGVTVASLRARANVDQTLTVEAAFLARSGQ
jgi:general secretion pathway protein M